MYSLTTKTTVDGRAGTASTVERVQTAAGRSRVEVFKSSIAPALAGMYMLFSLADSTLTSVLPGAQMAMTAKFAPPAPADSAATSVISNAKSEVRDLGPGEKIVDRDTHHYRVTRAATLTTRRSGQVCTRTVGGTEDIWISTDSALKATLDVTLKPLSGLAGLHPLLGESWTQLVDSSTKNVPEGVRLRSTRTERIVYPDGAAIERTLTSEFSEIAAAPIDSTLFALPKAYRVSDLREMNMSGPNLSEIVRKQLGGEQPGC